jgi:serine protease
MTPHCAGSRLLAVAALAIALVCASPRPAPGGAQLALEAPTAPREPTPDFTYLQSHLWRAQQGMGILPVRDLLEDSSGGRGAGVRIVDIEYSWNLIHEDLPFDETKPGYKPLFLDLRRVDRNPRDQGNHGAASLGILVALDNDYGVTGMCPDADIGLVNPNDATTGTYNLAAAIREAANALAPNSGDIILIEQQWPGPSPAIPELPVEWDPSVFEAIQYATARGLIVIEPAGNGGANLDAGGVPLNGLLRRNPNRDSGAIMVGAGYPPIPGVVNASRIPQSNYGSRLDVQGFGLYVATVGYGDHWGQPGRRGDPTWRYTSRFGGTSAAAATVAGVAAVIQGVVKDHGLPPLGPALMRAFLAGTGTPDYSRGKKRVGPRPDALVAVKAILADGRPYINTVEYLGQEDRLIVDGIYFAPGRSVIQFQTFDAEGQLSEPVSFATGFSGLAQHAWPAGMTTRLMTTESDIGLRIVPGQTAVITVVTPGDEPDSELRSLPYYFVRK